MIRRKFYNINKREEEIIITIARTKMMKKKLHQQWKRIRL
jgi:hypothetical protein